MPSTTPLARWAAGGEEALLQMPRSLLVRSGPAFGPAADEADPLRVLLLRLAAGERVAVSREGLASPTHVPDLVRNALDLLIDGETGTWHLMTPGAASPADLARLAAAAAGLETALLDPRPAYALGLPRPPSGSTVLASRRGDLLPPLAVALEAYAADLRRAAPALARTAAGLPVLGLGGVAAEPARGLI